MDESLINLFPERVRMEVNKYIKKNIQEIRIGIGKPCILIENQEEIILKNIVSKLDMKYIIQKISNYSIYAYEEEIRQGFITIKGGHRVGIAGQCVMENDRVKTIKNIVSLNIRICHEIIGCSDRIMRYINTKDRVNNTIIVSPPGCGKTTLLRDIANKLSCFGKRVSIIDERSEIAACDMGIPRLQVGLRTDVLDNCKKSIGMIMAIRSLSPEIIICDEIGSEEDIRALFFAYNSGITIITTVHGYDINDVISRNSFSKLIENKIIKKIIVLSKRCGIGTIERVYDLERGESICIG
ncbi:MAG: stage III sporulation protein AA [Clostridium sp.]|nr:stage III sporulation protein AA [Clostridium sp.]MDY3827854.1 stage III sporulation protein AA [Clostridium sp.]